MDGGLRNVTARSQADEDGKSGLQEYPAPIVTGVTEVGCGGPGVAGKTGLDTTASALEAGEFDIWDPLSARSTPLLSDAPIEARKDAHVSGAALAVSNTSDVAQSHLTTGWPRRSSRAGRPPRQVFERSAETRTPVYLLTPFGSGRLEPGCCGLPPGHRMSGGKEGSSRTTALFIRRPRRPLTCFRVPVPAAAGSAAELLSVSSMWASCNTLSLSVVSGYKSKSRNWLEMAASFGV